MPVYNLTCPECCTVLKSSKPVPAGKIATSPVFTVMTRPPSELHVCLAARDAKDFMNPRMIMHVVINSVAPRIAPTVLLKKFFEHRSRINLLGKRHRLAI